MLSPEALETVVSAVGEAEGRLLERIEDGRDSEEPAMTSSLAGTLETLVDRVSGAGVRVRVRVLDSAGAGAAESLLGADMCVVLDIAAAPGMRIVKGFLVQAKRSGREGLHYSPPSQPRGAYSHWLYRGVLQLDESGIVTVGRPSRHLAKQCRDMMKATPDAFIWLYGDHPVAIVSAAHVLAAFGRPVRTATRIPLGTKRLEDFFVHCLDCFIGDPSITAHDTASLLEQCRQREARFGLLVSVDAADGALSNQ